MRGEIRASTSDIRVIGIFEMLYLEGTAGEIIPAVEKSLNRRICIIGTGYEIKFCYILSSPEDNNKLFKIILRCR